eukprot:4968259-Amphidinium_carterae.1
MLGPWDWEGVGVDPRFLSLAPEQIREILISSNETLAIAKNKQWLKARVVVRLSGPWLDEVVAQVARANPSAVGRR